MPSAEEIESLLLVFAPATVEEGVALANQLIYVVIRPRNFDSVEDIRLGGRWDRQFEPRLSTDAVLDLH